MRFTKSPPLLVELFDGLVAETGGDRRLMFGCPCGFVNGNMFAGLFGAQLFLRLAEPDRAALLRQEGAAVFDPMGGRPMREYVVVPQDLAENAGVLRPWLKKALGYAASLPARARGRKPAARRPALRKPTPRSGRTRVKR